MKYIVFYDNDKNAAEERYVITSCQNKAGYVMDTLSQLGEKVDVVSPSLTKRSHGFFPAKSYSIDENITVHLPATLGLRTIFGRVIQRIWQWCATNLFVFFFVKSNETVIVYHSVALCPVIKALKRYKHIRLIMHVEEIYSDVSGKERQRKKEQQVFDAADAYLFPTIMLNQKINTKHKPYAIAHGTYRAEKITEKKYDDGRVHCVYAGTFDRVKGGSEAAIKCSQYLDKGYCLHIIGFGSGEETDYMKQLIREYQEKTDCEIVFDGEKRGEEFKRYIQKCHIGLSTQNPDAEYNNSSFPSKVLTYLVNGLSVVTVKIPALTSSDVNDIVTYYEGNDPSNVACAIRQVGLTLNTDEFSDQIAGLDQKFRTDFSRLVNELSHTEVTNGY